MGKLNLNINQTDEGNEHFRYESETRLVKPVIEGGTLHFQTDPFEEDGKIKILRYGSVKVDVVNVESQIDMQKFLSEHE